MAITFDAAIRAQSGVGASSLTFSHSVGVISNGILLVGISYYDLTQSVSTVTYNGVALTKILRTNNGSSNATTELWYLLSPASGANNVIITMTAALGGSVILIGGAISLSGVAQTVQEGSAGSVVTGSHTTHSDSTTTVAANAWVIDVVSYFAATPGFTANGSQTSRVSQTGGASSMAMSTLPVVSPASTSVGWSFTSTSLATAHSATSFAPAAASATLPGARIIQLGSGITVIGGRGF